MDASGKLEVLEGPFLPFQPIFHISPETLKKIHFSV